MIGRPHTLISIERLDIEVEIQPEAARSVEVAHLNRQEIVRVTRVDQIKVDRQAETFGESRYLIVEIYIVGFSVNGISNRISLGPRALNDLRLCRSRE